MRKSSRTRKSATSALALVSLAIVLAAPPAAADTDIGIPDATPVVDRTSDAVQGVADDAVATHQANMQSVSNVVGALQMLRVPTSEVGNVVDNNAGFAERSLGAAGGVARDATGFAEDEAERKIGEASSVAADTIGVAAGAVGAAERVADAAVNVVCNESVGAAVSEGGCTEDSVAGSVVGVVTSVGQSAQDAVDDVDTSPVEQAADSFLRNVVGLDEIGN